MILELDLYTVVCMAVGGLMGWGLAKLGDNIDEMDEE